MNRRLLPLLALLAAIIAIGTAVRPVWSQSGAPNPYDVISAVNALRAARGLAALQSDGSLMAAAQTHSDYMSANSLITHTGYGGTSPADRAVAAGYGGGAGVVVTENIAVAQVAAALDTIIYSIWGDSVHMNTMLNAAYTHIGAGVSTTGGQAYYSLKAGYISGGQTKLPANSTPAAAVSQIQPTVETIFTVETAAPADDGSIVHEVLPGQAPWSIATAYGIKIVDLAAMNNLDPNNPIIYAGQKLVIRVAYTPTVSPTVTETSIRPTRTPQPSATERPATRTPTVTITATPTNKPILPENSFLQSLDRRTIGIGIIVLCGLGLLMILASSLRKK
jgi:LysM repeat protein